MFSCFHLMGIAWEMVVGRILRWSMRVSFSGASRLRQENCNLPLAALHSIADFKKEHCYWWPWPYHVSPEKESSTFWIRWANRWDKSRVREILHCQLWRFEGDEWWGMWAASISLEWPENSDIIPTSARKCLLPHCHEPKKDPRLPMRMQCANILKANSRDWVASSGIPYQTSDYRTPSY